jgi:hypothetical protein
MKFKIFHFFTAIFLLFISCSSKSQTGINADSSFITFEGNLKEYKIDSCLADLLAAVVELDSNQLRFPSSQFYYDLTFEHRENYRFISITPSRWEKSRTLDFTGIIKVSQMCFLCRGNFQETGLFTETNKNITVRLKKPKAYQYDSIDVRIETFVWTPTLAGSYSFCKGAPINLYILVGKKLEGYKVQEND